MAPSGNPLPSRRWPRSASAPGPGTALPAPSATSGTPGAPSGTPPGEAAATRGVGPEQEFPSLPGEISAGGTEEWVLARSVVLV